jgi:hypothetical protein
MNKRIRKKKNRSNTLLNIGRSKMCEHNFSFIQDETLENNKGELLYIETYQCTYCSKISQNIKQI